MDNFSPLRKTLKRYEFPNHVHSLTFSCHKRQPLLVSDRTCNNLASSIVMASNKLNYGVPAYVFMPTHIHLIVHPENPEYSISDFLKLVKQSVARKEISYLKRKESEKLHFFESGWENPKYLFWLRGGGYDRNIIKPETLDITINYIHYNPVRKGLVSSILDWKWSSAQALLNNENGLIPLVKGFC